MLCILHVLLITVCGCWVFFHFLRQFMNTLTITLVLPPVVIQNSLEKVSCDICEKSKLHCSNEEYWNMKVCILL